MAITVRDHLSIAMEVADKVIPVYGYGGDGQCGDKHGDRVDEGECAAEPSVVTQGPEAAG